MITLPLHMRYGDKPRRPAGAWLIPGAEPQVWLDEMLAWGVPLKDAAFYLIPRSARDLAPQALLVVLPAGLQPRTTHRSQPYAARTHHAPRGEGRHHAERGEYILYLPVEARFEPEACDAEVAALAAAAGDCILHPSAGPIGLEVSDRLRVADLLACPAPRPARWDLAEPGQHFNARLTAILPTESPSLQVMIDQGRDDIGSESPSLDALPPEPGERGSGLFGGLLGDIGQRVQKSLAKMLQNLTGGEKKRPPQAGPGTSATKAAAKPGLLSKMANWARQKIEQIDEVMQKRRNREMHRLMHLLENDPDQGLRFALPCGEGEHRGIGRPGDKLPSRDVNFDIRRLGGGGPADPWQLPGDLHLRLRAKYMELAGREMRLGRYRRAAYIYAHLLNDFTNAAGALIAGKHWREAAAIYRDRLNRAADAARLLEQGGLWAEAIALYEQQENFEKVGDLYAKLEQPDEAESAWRCAVARLLARQDRIAAARLLDTKLQATDEALALLAAAWPDGSQASACLAEQFTMFGRLGRHDAAAARVEEIRAGNWPSDLRPRAIDRLGDVATGYPNDAVRTVAADAVRTLAATGLRTAFAGELEHLLNAVRRLVPADRLLERDTARYHRQRLEPSPVAAKPASRALVPQPHFSSDLTRVREFNLKIKAQWECAVACDGHFYAAGFADRKLCLTVANWNGRSKSHWRDVSQSAPIVFSLDARSKQGVLHLMHKEPIQAIAPIVVVLESVPWNCTFGSPPWIPSWTAAVTHHPGGTIHVLSVTDDGFVLDSLGPDGTPLGSRLLPYRSVFSDEYYARPERPVPIFSRGDFVYLGLGSRLTIVSGDKAWDELQLPGVVRSLCGSSPFSVGRIVATFDQGAALIWESGHAAVRFDESMHEPVACFTASGWIVLASADKLRVYKTEGRKIEVAARQRRTVRPIAALPTDDPDGFAIVGEDGTVEIYQMPRR